MKRLVLGGAACAPLWLMVGGAAAQSAETAFGPIGSAPSFGYVVGADGEAQCMVGMLASDGSFVASFAEEASVGPLRRMEGLDREPPSFGEAGRDAAAGVASVPGPGTGLLGALGLGGLLRRGRRRA